MSQKPSKGAWVITTKSFFSGEESFEKCKVGRVLRCDGPLLIVNFSGYHLALRRSDVVFLRKEDEPWKKY